MRFPIRKNKISCFRNVILPNLKLSPIKKPSKLATKALKKIISISPNIVYENEKKQGGQKITKKWYNLVDIPHNYNIYLRSTCLISSVGRANGC